MAGDFSTVNVILGGGAQNQVVTEAGVYFIQASLGPAGTPYWVYDGTNLTGNVPAGKGFAFLVNGVSKATIDSTGVIAGNQIQASTALSVAGGLNISGGAAGSAMTINSQRADGATAIAHQLTNNNTFSTAGAKLLSIQNNSAEKAYVDYAGNLTTSGILTSSGVNFGTTGTAPAGSQPAMWYDGTNLVGNVPTGKAFNWSVNGVSKFTLNTTTLTGPEGWTLNTASTGAVFGLPNGTSNPVFLNGVNLTNVQFKIDGPSSVTEQRTEIVQANHVDMGGQISMAHIAGGSAAVVPGDPASVGRVTIGLGAGTTSSGTAVTASGHDMAMRVGVTVNSTGTVSQPILLGSWAASYNRPPFIVESPGNAATAAIAVAQAPFLQTTTSGWSIIANTTGLSAGTYVWYLSGVIQ